MPRERSSAAVLAAAKSALGMLQPSERRRYWLLTAAQMATSLLDLVGVLLIGAVGLLATAAVSGRPLPESFVSTLDRFGLADVSIEQLAAWTAVIAALLLITKSLASGMLMRTTFAFLADCQGNLSSRLLSGLMARPILDIQLRSSQRIAYSLTMGTTAVITGLLGCLSLIASDAMLLVLLGAGLLVISPVVTIVAGIYFALVAVILHRSLAAWGARTGRVTGSTNIKSMARIQEGLAAYRELWTLDRRGPYLDETRAVLLESSRSRGTLAFINLVPKFAYDTALVIGALLLTAWQVRSTNLVSAMATLLLFLAAGSRLVPSMLRLNAQLVNVGAMSGQAEPTAELAALVTGPLPPGWRGTRTAADGRPADDRRDFQPVVEVRDVSVVYPGSTDAALDCVRFSVPAGSSVAVVGATGAGKSTLADVIIGLLPTDAGDVRISGLPPFEAITRWPGAVSYVPQHVALIDGSVRANVALALPPDQVDDDAVWNALRRAEVADFIASLPDGLDTAIGERGVRLSGGQRQRLGLARGLLSDPQVLILDEATSALDADTEHAIGESISAMEGAVTVIVIAHRLATVRRVDALAYLEDGRLVAFGSFDEVRQQVPAFDRQADLMGLNS